MSQLPTITVDRTVGHYVSKIEVDWEEIARFYESLPHDGKPPLSHCHIYFSGLKVCNVSRMTIYGAHFAHKTQSRVLVDPLAPHDTDVMVFVGSFAASKQPLEELTRTLRHELAHYAGSHQFRRVVMSKEEWRANVMLQFRLLRVPELLRFLAMLLCSILTVVLACWITGERFSTWPAFAASAVVGVGLLVQGRKTSAAKRRRAQERVFMLYKQREDEQDAVLHEQSATGPLVVVSDVTDHPKVDWRLMHMRGLTNWAVDVVHGRMSLTPQGRWFSS